MKSIVQDFCSENSFAQGTIEYLIVIGGVIVLSLVVVGLLTGVIDFDNGVSLSQSEYFWSSQPLGMSDAGADSNGNSFFIVTNNMRKSVTLTGYRVGGVVKSFTGTTPVLAPGEKKVVFISGQSACSGSVCSWDDFAFTYRTRYGLDESSASIDLAVEKRGNVSYAMFADSPTALVCVNNEDVGLCGSGSGGGLDTNCAVTHSCSNVLYVGDVNSFTDTNTQTINWTDSNGNWLIDLNVSKINPEIRLINTDSNEYSRWLKTNTTNFAYQYNRVSSTIIATGGTITIDGLYTIHTFTSSGAFMVTGGTLDCNLLVVAGGGSGGGRHSGGGGGGGVIYVPNAAISANTYTVTVGAGGNTVTDGSVGNNGQDSFFGIIGGINETAKGGGGGGRYPEETGNTGGSGGGGGSNSGSGPGGSASQPVTNDFGTATGYASAGGNGYGSCSNDLRTGGGGGGAGATGGNSAACNGNAGNGGNGIQINIDGNNYYYGAGGGGCMWSEDTTSYTAGNGGLGGGGGGSSESHTGTSGPAGSGGTGGRNNGGNGDTVNNGGAGGTNTGSGGGAASQYYAPYSQYGTGGAGGSGIVVIRYLTPTVGTSQETVVWSSRDGISTGEKGVNTFGDIASRTVLDGKTLRFNIGGVEKFATDASGNLTAPDNWYHYFGTANDARISYDGTNLLINPKVIGTGKVIVQGDLNTTENIYTDKNIYVTGNSLLTGNVGIGTTSPNSLLSVYSATNGTRIGRFVSQSSSTSTIGALQAVSAQYSGSALDVGHWSQDSANWAFRAYGNVNRGENANVNDAGSVFLFGVRSDGRVGIGTTGPATILDVNGVLTLRPTASASTIQTNSTEARMDFITDRSVGTYRAFAFGDAAGNYSMSILDNGDVGIGVTAPGRRLEVSTGTTAAYPLRLTSNGYYAEIGALNSSYVHFNVNTSAGTYFYQYVTFGAGHGDASSRTLKTNITPITNALGKVSQLNGVYFDWIANGKHDIGMIAEDVNSVLPEVVSSVDGKPAAISYDHITALLVEATKELKKENDALKLRIDKLENKAE